MACMSILLKEGKGGRGLELDSGNFSEVFSEPRPERIILISHRKEEGRLEIGVLFFVFLLIFFKAALLNIT